MAERAKASRTIEDLRDFKDKFKVSIPAPPVSRRSLLASDLLTLSLQLSHLSLSLLSLPSSPESWKETSKDSTRTST